MDSLPPLAVHVDLDGVPQIFRAHGRVFRGSGDPIFATGMENMLQLFADVGIRATLFLIAEDVHDAAKRDAVERALRAGHEIASHTVTHPNLLRVTRAEKERELKESKSLIADTFGVPVTGFRAPGYAMDAEGLRILADAGYLYDSSVFPTATFEERLGRSRKELRHPQRFDAFGGIVELPLPGPVVRSTPIGPSFALAFGLAPFYWAMARAARRGLPTVLLFHLIDFATPLAREYRDGALMSLFTLSTRSERSKQAAVERMLRFVAQRFRLTTTAELLEPFVSGPATRFSDGSPSA
jgi:hypothetical protein